MQDSKLGAVVPQLELSACLGLNNKGKKIEVRLPLLFIYLKKTRKRYSTRTLQTVVLLWHGRVRLTKY